MLGAGDPNAFPRGKDAIGIGKGRIQLFDSSAMGCWLVWSKLVLVVVSNGSLVGKQVVTNGSFTGTK